MVRDGPTIYFLTSLFYLCPETAVFDDEGSAGSGAYVPEN